MKDANIIKNDVMDSEMFYVLQEAYISIDHGWWDRMTNEALIKYKNKQEQIKNVYKQLCNSCQIKSKNNKKN